METITIGVFMRVFNKPKMLYAICLLVIILTCMFVSYRIGFSRGETQGLADLRGNFVIEVSALYELQNKTYNKAIKDIEANCYAAATTLLENNKWRENRTVRMFCKELANYRNHFANPKHQWTATEVELEKLLLQTKIRNAADNFRCQSDLCEYCKTVRAVISETTASKNPKDPEQKPNPSAQMTEPPMRK